MNRSNVKIACIALSSFLPLAFISGCSTSPGSPQSSLSINGPSSLRAGQTATFVASETSVAGAVQWSVNGIAGGNQQVGTIDQDGVYTAPALLPANNVVAVSCSVVTARAVCNQFSVTLLNPEPVLTSGAVSPAGGMYYAVDLHGTGFVPGSRLIANGVSYQAAFISSTELKASVPIVTLQASSEPFQIENPNPGSTDSTVVNLAIPLQAATPTAAARLLDQATFGPTLADIEHVESIGLLAYIKEQMAIPATQEPYLPWDYSQLPSFCRTNMPCLVQYQWWNTAVFAPDQLRQKVGYILGEIIQVSMVTVDAHYLPFYQNSLANDAFGNWRQIMEDITLNPAVATFLNNANNLTGSSTQIPDENFARENLQLFNLGPLLLNQDGTLQTDANGNPIPTYTEAQVQAFARAYTGLTYGGPQNAPTTCLPQTAPSHSPFGYTCFMVPIGANQYHDLGPKTLLNGVTLPAGQDTLIDIRAALDNIFGHSNLPPYIAKRLIQGLVESNPSPAYVKRVADVFVDNGKGVRGDMAAVITAILMDPEARTNDDPNVTLTNAGKLRENMLWQTAVMRSLNAQPTVSDISWAWTPNMLSFYMGEQPEYAPTVFGFFSPNYTLPNSNVVAPEFQTENTGTIYQRLHDAQQWAEGGWNNLTIDLTKTGSLGASAVQGADALIDQLNLVMLHGRMSTQMRSSIESLITGKDPGTMIRLAVYIVITSSEYKVQT